MIDAIELSVRVFADGADVASIRKLAADPLIAGFTTNPTLMRKAAVDDYEQFAHELLECITDRPISFEVFSDDFDEMRRQARKIASWGDNVYVKIPITNTEGMSSLDLVRTAHGRGSEAQRHGADDKPTGRCGRRGTSGRHRRPSCRCSPAASPTRVASQSPSWCRRSRPSDPSLMSS